METSDTTRTDPSAAAGSRLRLDPVLGRRGALDGGWWPRSYDATLELPVIVTAMADHDFQVSRLTVDSNDWTDIPRRGIEVGGRTVRIGRIPGLEHQIIVTIGRSDDLMILVVPPNTAPDAAERALDGAAAGLASKRPNDILADRHA